MCLSLVQARKVGKFLLLISSRRDVVSDVCNFVVVDVVAVVYVVSEVRNFAVVVIDVVVAVVDAVSEVCNFALRCFIRRRPFLACNSSLS